MPFWKKTPRQRTSIPDLVPLIKCWSLSKSHHRWSPGASDKQISKAEDSLKVRLPKVLRAIYELSNGFSLVGGNINFYVLESTDDTDEFTLVNLTSKMREWNCSIPEELLLFGDDGGESQFGLWISERERNMDDCPVIELSIENGAMAIAGTGLCCFLKGRTAYHLQAEDAAESLDALGLPEALHSENPDDGVFSRIIKWADPSIPDPLPDPYERGVTADQLRDRFSSPKG